MAPAARGASYFSLNFLVSVINHSSMPQLSIFVVSFPILRRISRRRSPNNETVFSSSLGDAEEPSGRLKASCIKLLKDFTTGSEPMSASLKDVFLYSSDSIFDVANLSLFLFLFFGSDAQAVSLINKTIKGSRIWLYISILSSRSCSSSLIFRSMDCRYFHTIAPTISTSTGVEIVPIATR